MKLYDFIFSEKKSQRVWRHIAFWLLWWLYFTASYFHYEQSGLQKVEFEQWTTPFLLRSVLLLSIHVAASYYFTAFLMPKYLFAGRYMLLFVHVTCLAILIFLSNYYIHSALVPRINELFNYQTGIANQNTWWTSISSGLLSAPKVISAAAAIKLIKRWWIKEKEKERLQKEKLMTDLLLLKSQVHPDFLFSSLDNLYSLTLKKDKDRASLLLLKLSDILSYMLYESDSNRVLLSREIQIIKDYLILQKTIMGNRLETDIAVKGDTGTRTIAPLLLFSLIEGSFTTMCHKNLDQPWINLECRIGNDELTVKIIHANSSEITVSNGVEYGADQTRKWLDHFYFGKYELKTTAEPEIMMTSLKLILKQTENGMGKHVITEKFDYAAE